ncbi:MAG: ion transporter [Opitutales bacterium]|jgi:voltage-gated potassium channel|nr:ion transporter [Opitutales bacterium]MDP4644084.1 ion transporter [Opitutales bacterium]MDP4778415.1 ion transporter [Opitutales bacterium]MDP4883340.1 ion transporter [Opitutales bacterium]MDP5080069.1 ion transporter [Opitutales bacterium]
MVSRFRTECRRIIFQSHRWDEKAFDVVLILAILLSVCMVMLESIPTLSADVRHWLYVGEWLMTGLFTVEYILRLYVSEKPAKYSRSFFGVVDLLAILPTYIDLLLPGAHYLMLLRVLRVLRIFRVLKLAKYIGEANTLMRAMRSSARKIAVFIFTVVILVLILGSLMYLIEGEDNGFTSIPKSVYWAIVTLTTVGYGDISPQTPLGQFVASLIMITGYGIIAVPTAIVTAEMTHPYTPPVGKDPICPACGWENHDKDATFCKVCGDRLPELPPKAAT